MPCEFFHRNHAFISLSLCIVIIESRGIFEAAHLCYLLAGEPITTENGMILLGTDLMLVTRGLACLSNVVV